MASFTHVIEFCHALSKIDNITLISQANPATLSVLGDYKYLQIKPIQVRPHNLGYILSTIKTYFFLSRITQVNKPDVIYQRAVAFSLGPLIFARIKNIPAILEINGNWEDEHKIATKHLLFPKKQLITFINTLRGYSLILACRMANQLIVVTPNIATFLQQKGLGNKKSILIAPNGVNLERFNLLDKLECKNNLGLDPNINYIGYIGSISTWQGVDDLIYAYTRLPREISMDFHLLIVGDGPELHRCMKISQGLELGNSVIFTGAQPYVSIPKYMGACSVLVAPKKPLASGYSPLKIYEYLASGRPILASKVEGLGFIEECNFGLLFSPGDVSDFAIKLQDILGIPEDIRMKMGECGRQYVVTNHSWNTIVKTIQQYIYAKFVNRNGNMPE